MKTRNLIQLGALFIAVTCFSLSGCKKDKIDQGNSDPASLEQLSTDENNVNAVTNDALNDVEGVLSYQAGSLKSTEGIPCNATIDSTSIQNDTLTLFITYNGLSCNGKRNRVGQIEIRKKVGTHWGQAGSSVKYTYINYAVTRVSTGKTITLNGTKTFENVSGGFIWQLGTTRTSIIQKVSGSMMITFDDGSTRTWSVARQRTYTGIQGNLLLTEDGFGTEGNYTNLVTWGINRKGEQFYSQLTQSMVQKQSCGWDPVSGIKIHQIPSDNKSATITFGYNSNNEPITGDECPTRYRVDWVKGTHSGTAYLQLP